MITRTNENDTPRVVVVQAVVAAKNGDEFPVAQTLDGNLSTKVVAGYPLDSGDPKM